MDPVRSNRMLRVVTQRGHEGATNGNTINEADGQRDALQTEDIYEQDLVDKTLKVILYKICPYWWSDLIIEMSSHSL